MPVEAKSLASLINLAENPPPYPRNPSHEPLQSLTLYIVRVPGSRDVFLSPLKPGSKDAISPESLYAALYYLHVAGPEDDAMLSEIKQSETCEHTADGTGRQSAIVTTLPKSDTAGWAHRSSSVGSTIPPELEKLNRVRRKPVGGWHGANPAAADSHDGPTSPIDPELAEAARAVLPYVYRQDDPERHQVCPEHTWRHDPSTDVLVERQSQAPNQSTTVSPGGSLHQPSSMQSSSIYERHGPHRWLHGVDQSSRSDTNDMTTDPALGTYGRPAPATNLKQQTSPSGGIATVGHGQHPRRRASQHSCAPIRPTSGWNALASPGDPIHTSGEVSSHIGVVSNTRDDADDGTNIFSRSFGEGPGLHKNVWNVTQALHAGRRLTAGLARRATGGRTRAASAGSKPMQKPAEPADGNDDISGTSRTVFGQNSQAEADAPDVHQSDVVRVAPFHRSVHSWDGRHTSAGGHSPTSPNRNTPGSSHGQQGLSSQQQQLAQQSLDSVSQEVTHELQGNRSRSSTLLKADQPVVSNSHLNARHSASQPPLESVVPESSVRGTMKPYHVTVIRRAADSGAQWNVATFTNASATDDSCVDADNDIQVKILTPGYRRFAGNSNPLALGGLGLVVDDLPPALKEAMTRAMSRPADSDHSTRGDVTAATIDLRPQSNPAANANEPLVFTRILTLRPGHARSTSEAGLAEGTRRYNFTSPWHGVCTFEPGTAGQSLKLRHTVTSVGAAGHTSRSHRRNPSLTRSRSRGRDQTNSGSAVVAAEVRFSLPLLQPALTAQHARHGKARAFWSTKVPSTVPKRDHLQPEEATQSLQIQASQAGYSSLSNYMHCQSPLIDQEVVASRSTEPAQFPEPSSGNVGNSNLGTSDPSQRLDLSLGRERGGGGIRGRSSKLGKLVLHDEGMKMMDLSVSACMAVWWNAYEAIDV